jgi:ribose transport system substrate-binding protein
MPNSSSTQIIQMTLLSLNFNNSVCQITVDKARAIAGDKASGFAMPIHLVTKDNVGVNSGTQGRFDPDNGYRDTYKNNWGK